MAEKLVECGSEGCVPLSKAIGEMVSKNSYIVWTAIIIFTFGTAVYGVDLKCADKVDKAALETCLDKINKKLDAISNDTSEIRANQKVTLQYIEETKPRDAKQDERIRSLEIKDAARGR